MDHQEDWELLEQFRLRRWEPAFAELARRHAGFVLATCRRRLRDAHLAEDAAQAVFLVLARRPPTRSSGNASLAGWLYKTAVYACNNAMRSKRSRDLHERMAAAQVNATTAPAATSLDRADAEELLDRALAELSGKERDAVLLRFYQEQSVQQVGAALGISQNTATKRIGRAIERMRGFLADKGFAISSPALAAAIGQAMRTPEAQPEFITKVIAVATGQSIASAIVQQLAEGVHHMIRVAKMKLVAAVVGVVVTAGGGVIAVNQLMAQSNAPKTPTVVASNTPATQPARVGAATPKDALRALAVAGAAADVDAIKALVDVKDPRGEQLLVAACEYATTRKTFLETVETKFGEPALTRLNGSMRVSTFDVFLRDLETRTDTLTEQIQGNEATIATERSEYGDIRMIRDDAGWKLAATNMTKDWPEEKYTKVLTNVQQGNVALANLTNDMNDGKIAAFPDLMRNVRAIMSELRNK